MQAFLFDILKDQTEIWLTIFHGWAPKKRPGDRPCEVKQGIHYAVFFPNHFGHHGCK